MKITPPVYDPYLLDCIIVDLEGTLALFDRDEVRPYDRDFSRDEVNEAVKEILDSQRECHEITSIYIFSERKDVYREQTEQWLRDNDVAYDYLCMRRNDDNRSEAIVKEEMYNEYIKGKYNALMVIEDGLSVCRLWYRLGLPLFRVGDPDASF